MGAYYIFPVYTCPLKRAFDDKTEKDWKKLMHFNYTRLRGNYDYEALMKVSTHKLYSYYIIPRFHATHVLVYLLRGFGGQKRERIKQELEEVMTIIKFLESNDRFADNLLRDLADGKLEGGVLCYCLFLSRNIPLFCMKYYTNYRFSVKIVLLSGNLGEGYECVHLYA